MRFDKSVTDIPSTLKNLVTPCIPSAAQYTAREVSCVRP